MFCDVCKPVVFLAGALLVLTPSLQSLPMFRQLFESKANYKVNCTLCHQPKDGRLTPYGHEYLRLGGGREALQAMDVMDPDRDGYSSQEEIRTFSNPGDSRSAPRHVGDWLAEIRSTPAPKKALSEVFGRSYSCQLVEKKLSDAQAHDAEQFIKGKLLDEDRFLTIFVIQKWLPPLERRSDERKEAPFVWHAAYAYWGDKKLSVLLVILGPNSTLRAVRAVRIDGDQRFAKEDYLKQFMGKTYTTLQGVTAPRGAEAENAKVLAAVKKAMKIIDLSKNEVK
ncbi:MAG: hypothetical protein HY548_04930 [Elusimicrobia bacterium]|nr:hypothetical protein [Elusimicrobiota bacterium]